MQKKKPYDSSRIRSEYIQLRLTKNEKEELKKHKKEYDYNTTGQLLREAIRTQIEKDKNN
jgi:hypothetical protein